MARNKKGQITRIKPIEIKLSKRIQEIADEVAIRVKPIVRDELESTLRSEIYASYTPATKKGQQIKEYNESHKHQKVRPYHHTGLLASKVDAVIDEDMVKAIIRDGQYKDGATTSEVYDYLKFGTRTIPSEKDVYSYNNGNKFSMYISQEPHNFEARTKEYMDQFLEDLENDLLNNPEKYSNKYKNKRL